MFAKKKKLSLFLFLTTIGFAFCFTGFSISRAYEACKIDGTQSVPGNFNVPPNWFPALEYAPANPEEIHRNESIVIKVIGGIPPYTWTVSSGFVFQYSQTKALSNTMSADGTACGAARIKIADKKGKSATGYVREVENSEWVEQPQLADTCPSPGPATDNERFDYAERIAGKIKIAEKAVKGDGYPVATRCGRYDFCSGWGENCGGVCEAENCSNRGCSECITAAGQYGFLSEKGYGCTTYPWQNVFWCCCPQCCYCMCNAYTKVYYWQCKQ